MKRLLCVLLMGFTISTAMLAQGQTKLKLSAIKPGTEQVQLILNGDFQMQGPLVGTNYPNPTGWSRGGDMFATAGTNTVAYNSGVVAKGQLNSGSGVGSYTRILTLEPATSYVLSAYLWNFGNSTNHVNTVVDLNDAPNEPQIVLGSGDQDADKGYFFYRSFTTADTGTNLTLRAFYDGLTGTGCASNYFPLAAQWDNIAITRAVNFLPPQASNSTATIRPLVSITNPLHGASFYLNSQSGLLISAAASDLDGAVTNVQFLAGTSKIGESSSAPWSTIWTATQSGTFVLTAVAVDNAGATTLSAPITVTLNVSPLAPILGVSAGTGSLALRWPDGTAPMLVQSTTNLVSPIWKVVTNQAATTNGTNFVVLTVDSPQKFFRLASEVDPGTLYRKMMMGYQGWFACPGDGSQPNRWVHWFRNNTPTATNLTVDFWPDTTELDPDELFATGMTYSNSATAKLYSAYNQKTVSRHFKWMRDYHIDGVFLQRFTTELSDPAYFSLRNQVTANVRAGADAYGRVFAIMYDISGQSTNTLLSILTNDWTYLTASMQLTNSPFYLRHKGKPVVAVWGFGFSGRPDSPQQAQQAVDFFHAAGCTILGGFPTYWRTLNNDAQTNVAWGPVFRSFDIISPWAVGRYGDITGADNFRLNLIVPDMVAAASAGRDYMPVIFPGFSWYNLNAGPLNQIPRKAGTFYWRQAYNAVLSGCNMIYGAMFDEVDEGTAMFKLAATPADLPAQGAFVPLNADGTNVTSDWYLKLANEASKMLRGDIPLQPTMPITP